MKPDDIKKATQLEIARERKKSERESVISFALFGLCLLAVIGLIVVPDLALTKIVAITAATLYGIHQLLDMWVLHKRRQYFDQVEKSLLGQLAPFIKIEKKKDDGEE